MTYRWILRPVPSEDAVRDIGQQLNNLPEALSRALILRGIDTFDSARAFFRPSAGGLHDPFLMADMDAAADRVARAIRDRERIVVYGDYDVDGTTSSALLISSLRSLGGDVGFFVPNRFEHGYGLSRMGLDVAAQLGARLIVAVDCGVTASEEARYAREKGMDLVVCDHHTPKGELPDAEAVLDPKRTDCPYPFKELAGCGVAFKLLQGVLVKLGRNPEAATEFLDLVAVATASDMVPVEDENRILLALGLERLRKEPSSGLRALAAVANMSLSSCTATDVVFRIAPRINAAGRMSTAEKAIDLLLAEDPETAKRCAEELNKLNDYRREIDQETLEAATKLAERQITSKMRHTLVLHRNDWFPGVIGIVASRLVERFHRPTILLGTIDGVATGSARSIGGVNIFEALRECEDLLVKFGGHAFAAGLSLEISNLPALQERFDEAVGKVVTPEVLQPSIHVDAPLHLHEIDRRFLAVLKQFEPFGPGNDRPVFQANGLLPVRPPRKVGKDSRHLKFVVRQQDRAENEAPMEAIGFGMGGRFDMLEQCRREQQPFDMLFSLKENTWNGHTETQLQAKDIRRSAPPA